MNVRTAAAALLAIGALASAAPAASATCYLGSIDICHKPTDPYTDPVYDRVYDVEHNPALAPAWGAVGTASNIVGDAYADALCLVLTPKPAYC